MKAMGLRMAAAVFLVACWTSSAEGMARPPASGGGWDGDTYVYASGEWTLRIHYLHKGTRSEGQDGALLRNGEPVAPSEPGAELDTPVGRLRHYGDARRNLWDVTGWNFADKSKVKSSAALPPALPATRTAPGDARIHVTNGLDAAVDLSVGQRLRARLSGSAGTGFLWSHAAAPDAAVLRDDGVAVEAAAGQPGGAETRLWSYTAVAPGRTDVAWQYARPWETNAAPAMTARVAVTVHE